MALEPKRSGTLVLRLIVGLALLGWPRLGSAQGTWSVIPLPPKPGEVVFASDLAVDAAGNLYIADEHRIQKRDAQGKWSVIATLGDDLGQVGFPSALAVDSAGNLYVAEFGNKRIQKRDLQGNWSVIATHGKAPGQVLDPRGLAVDGAGNLYVAEVGEHYLARGDYGNSRIQKRDAQGSWSVIAAGGRGPGQVWGLPTLALDAADNLYVADYDWDSVTGKYSGRIQKRDARGNWSVIATEGTDLGHVSQPRALALDRAGNLYVADLDDRIQKRDPQGDWSVIATPGYTVYRLAADTAGNLYVAESSVSGVGVQRRDAQGNWLPIAIDTYQSGWYLTALAVDAAGNLHAAVGGILWKREAQGNWTLLAAGGVGPGQVSLPADLAVDATGNLYVADERQSRNAQGNWSVIATSGRIQKRDAQGDWSVIAARLVSALAVDTAGHLYAADHRDGEYRIEKRDAQGNWSVIATGGMSLGQVWAPSALDFDAADNLYVADSSYGGRIQKRDAQGNWFVIAPAPVRALAVDRAGNLYAAAGDLLWKQDAQGNWSVFATYGTALGQVSLATDLAVDGAGNLYVADTGNNRVLKYAPSP